MPHFYKTRLSELLTKTSKSVPADEEAKNAQLLIQAGYIHKEMAGVYAYLPLGVRVLENIAEIVRQEMDKAGGQEVFMSVLQPKEIWEKTDRWDDQKVDNWFKTELTNGTKLGVGLTHEEPVIDMLKAYVSSYKDLPLKVYQIQSKFRNEKRAKSGLMRGREFMMKDMYSFARNQQEHDKIYEELAEVYLKVYNRLGLGDITYRTFASGGIFSKFSDEFQTLSPVGEDAIYVHEGKRIAVNKEVYTDDILAELDLKKEELVEKQAVEVGNIFPLGSKYTDALDLKFTDEEGQLKSIVMGCYGIGISRLMGVLAEHFSDDKGLCWPDLVSPAQVYLVTVGEDEKIQQAGDKLYQALQNGRVSVIYDDRDVRAGQKFADADLLGIPHRVVISSKTLGEGGDSAQAEYKHRRSEQANMLPLNKLIERLSSVPQEQEPQGSKT